MLSLRLPAEAEDRLTALAKANGCTKTHFARELILECLGDLEDLYLAQRELEAVRTGRSRTYTLEEVERNLGLAVEPRPRPSYTLDELLAQCDETADFPEEDRQWLDCAPVGKELL